MYQNPSADSRLAKKAFKAVLPILLFLFVYVFFVFLAIALTCFACYIGILFILSASNLFSIVAGLVVIGMGLVLFFFLVNLLFNIESTSNRYTEIKEAEHPALFALISELVNKTNTYFPKKVFLSADVNAIVIYSSNFWSMFLPVKKNIVIGLGLVNSVTREELKAILSHEFGHFSQRSMIVGSYVYHVNKVVYNVIYDTPYRQMLQKWSNASVFYFIPATIAAIFANFTQAILRKVYEHVNLVHFDLSREMEYEADKVTASITGHLPLISALRRMELAAYCYNQLAEFYGSMFQEGIKTLNIYPQQILLMKLIANKYSVPLSNGLPDVTEELLEKLDTSKVSIENPWTSHPSIHERAEKFKYSEDKRENIPESAWIFFRNPIDLQEKITAKLFEEIKFSDQPLYLDEENFTGKFEEWRNDFNNNYIYGGFYDDREIEPFDVIEGIQDTSHQSFRGIEEAYSKDNIQLAYQLKGHENDIDLLNKISSGTIRVKHFQYAGIRHDHSESLAILDKVREDYKTITHKLNSLDRSIFLFFLNKAAKMGKQKELEDKYEIYFRVTSGIDNHFKMYADTINASAFFRENIPMNQIKLKIYDLKKVEEPFKKKLAEFFVESVYTRHLSKKEYDHVENYLSAKLEYFQNPFYSQPMINLLFNALNAYIKMVSQTAPKVKRELLDFQLSLCEDEIASVTSRQ